MEACIVLLCQQSKNLDNLQHSIMHLQYCIRMASLICVPEKDIEKEMQLHFNELKTTSAAWSTLKFVRYAYHQQVASSFRCVTITLQGDCGRLHARRRRESHQGTLEDATPHGVHMPTFGNGSETVKTDTSRCLIPEQHEISIEMIRNTADSFASRAEWLLRNMDVSDLTDEEVHSVFAFVLVRHFSVTLSQVASIQDPLASNGESGNISLLLYNSILSEKYSEITQRIAEKGNKKTLDQMTELHLCVICLAAMEGAGQLRFSEVVSALFSSPNHLARRTLFWENQRLTVAYDWTKVSSNHVVYICLPDAFTD
jgi:hypothetical protein